MRFKTTSVAQRRAAAKLRHNKWQTFFAVFPTRYTDLSGQATGEWCWLERYLRTSRDSDGYRPWIRMPATALLTTKRDASGRLRDAMQKDISSADNAMAGAAALTTGVATAISQAMQSVSFAEKDTAKELFELSRMLQKNQDDMNAAIRAAQDGN